MRPFSYVRAPDEAAALAFAREPKARFLAGGTNLVDLMRLGVEQPELVVDLGALPLAKVEDREDGLHLGAMVRNSDLAVHPLVASRYPALAQALLSGASPQLRNMATVGGNLLQRTRCPYFRDPTTACNKRTPGAGCAALDGYDRDHAVLGTSERCIAAHASDQNVALTALDAVVHVHGAGGARAIAMADFHVVPGETPEVETTLAPGELITRVVLPRTAMAARSGYVKARDRASYEFALASAAVALHVEGGTIRDARVALGGVATTPWRSRAAEAALVGKKAEPAAYAAAAAAATEGARPRRHNAFKVLLAQRTLVRALSLVGGER